MCATDPLYAFEVSKARLDKLAGNPDIPEDKGILGTLREKLTQEQAFNVLHELGLGDGMTFTSQGALRLRLTDLQIVAYTAALAAVSESGGKMVERETFNHQAANA